MKINPVLAESSWAKKELQIQSSVDVVCHGKLLMFIDASEIT